MDRIHGHDEFSCHHLLIMNDRFVSVNTCITSFQLQYWVSSEKQTGYVRQFFKLESWTDSILLQCGG